MVSCRISPSDKGFATVYGGRVNFSGSFHHNASWIGTGTSLSTAKHPRGLFTSHLPHHYFFFHILPKLKSNLYLKNLIYEHLSVSKSSLDGFPPC